MSLKLLISVISTAIILACLEGPIGFGQTVKSFADIDFWVGNGTQSAALAIDWKGESTSDTSLVWGYRWEGVASTADMLVDVLTADSRLYAKLGTIAGLGAAVAGLGYDENKDGLFAISDPSPFDERGIYNGDLDDGATSVDPADRYAEGWFLGYWHLGYASTNPYDGGFFSSTSTGVSGTMLTNNSWVSLAFTTDTFSISDFAENPIAAESPFSADFNRDGDIDGGDFLAWQRSFGLQQDASLEQGDANGDQRVDMADFQVWEASFGHSTALGSSRSIPEPGSIPLVFFATLLFLGLRLTPRSRLS